MTMKNKKHSEETKRKMSEKTKNRIISKEIRKKISETRIKKEIAKGKNNPMYGKHHSEKTRQKMSMNRKDTFGENNPMYGKHHSEETKKKWSKIRTGKKHTEEEKIKMKKNHPHLSGENAPGWKGGLSFLPYSSKFNNRLRKKIRDRDNYTCQNPHCQKKNSKDVHHIDYKKLNCNENNLITLCHSCHNKTNGHREYWKEFYQNIINKEESYNELRRRFTN